MKIKFWTYTQNGCDGTASPCFFATEKQAQKYRKKYEKEVGETWAEDCINFHELEFDEEGILQNPDTFK